MEIDSLKYYIFAFDIDKGHITAALSCPDEKTAKEIFLVVSRKMELEYGTKGFSFGHTRVRDTSQFDNDFVDLLGEVEVSINYTSPPRGGQKIGKTHIEGLSY